MRLAGWQQCVFRSLLGRHRRVMIFLGVLRGHWQFWLRFRLVELGQRVLCRRVGMALTCFWRMLVTVVLIVVTIVPDPGVRVRRTAVRVKGTWFLGRLTKVIVLVVVIVVASVAGLVRLTLLSVRTTSC